MPVFFMRGLNMLGEIINPSKSMQVNKLRSTAGETRTFGSSRLYL